MKNWIWIAILVLCILTIIGLVQEKKISVNDAKVEHDLLENDVMKKQFETWDSLNYPEWIHDSVMKIDIDTAISKTLSTKTVSSLPMILCPPPGFALIDSEDYKIWDKVWNSGPYDPRDKDFIIWDVKRLNSGLLDINIKLEKQIKELKFLRWHDSILVSICMEENRQLRSQLRNKTQHL